jgi:hypothetical protein
MSHPAIIKASALIHAGDISAAESALTELVDTEGDNALVEVLDELAPKDLLAIIREYDSSKESVINLLITPKQFADAVVMERLYAEKNRDRLRSMINSIIYRDDVDPDEFIAALCEKNMGLEVLADYLDERFDEMTTFRIYGSFVVQDEERIPKDEEDDATREDQFEVPRGGISLDEVSDRDWMETIWRLAHNFPDEFLHVHQILSGRNRTAEAPVVSREEPEAQAGGTDAGKGPAGQPPAEESAL